MKTISIEKQLGKGDPAPYQPYGIREGSLVLCGDKQPSLVREPPGKPGYHELLDMERRLSDSSVKKSR